jgi:hypothetical protein
MFDESINSKLLCALFFVHFLRYEHTQEQKQKNRYQNRPAAVLLQKASDFFSSDSSQLQVGTMALADFRRYLEYRKEFN